MLSCLISWCFWCLDFLDLFSFYCCFLVYGMVSCVTCVCLIFFLIYRVFKYLLCFDVLGFLMSWVDWYLWFLISVFDTSFCVLVVLIKWFFLSKMDCMISQALSTSSVFDILNDLILCFVGCDFLSLLISCCLMFVFGFCYLKDILFFVSRVFWYLGFSVILRFCWYLVFLISWLPWYLGCVTFWVFFWFFFLTFVLFMFCCVFDSLNVFFLFLTSWVFWYIEFFDILSFCLGRWFLHILSYWYIELLMSLFVLYNVCFYILIFLISWVVDDFCLCWHFFLFNISSFCISLVLFVSCVLIYCFLMFWIVWYFVFAILNSFCGYLCFFDILFF